MKPRSRESSMEPNGIKRSPAHVPLSPANIRPAAAGSSLRQYPRARPGVTERLEISPDKPVTVSLGDGFRALQRRLEARKSRTGSVPQATEAQCLRFCCSVHPRTHSFLFVFHPGFIFSEFSPKFSPFLNFFAIFFLSRSRVLFGSAMQNHT